MLDITASINKFSLAIQPDDPQWPSAITPTEIPNLLVYQRQPATDNRGFFYEPIEKRDLEKVFGTSIDIKQWNHSRSLPNVIRGFHAEPWDKIVYVASGKALAVIVDLRVDSPAFGKTLKFELGEDNRRALFLPEGMGNSFCSLGDQPTDYLYLITGYFEGKPTPAVFYNDPMLTQQFGGWPIKNPIVSEKDAQYPTLKEKFGNEVDFTKFPWLQQ